MGSIKIAIEAINNLDKEGINSFLEKCEDATIFHTIEWNEILAKSFPDNEFNFLVAKQNNDVVGLYSYVTKSIFFKIKCLLSPFSGAETIYGGPIAIDTEAIRKNEIMTFLLKKSEKIKGIVKFNIQSFPAFNSHIFQELNYGVRKGKTYIVDLNTDEKNSWNNLRKKTRNGVRKAIKNGVTVENIDVNNKLAVDEYYKMIVSTFSHAGISLKPKEFYENVIKSLIRKNLAKFLMAVYENKFIAGAIFLNLKYTIYYWHNASYREFLYLAPNNVIQWELIKWGCKNGFNRYDLLYISPEKQPGIAKFKMGWGKGSIVNFYYAKKEKSLYKMGKSLKNLIHLNKR